MKRKTVGLALICALIASSISLAGMLHARADRAVPLADSRGQGPSLVAWLGAEAVLPDGAHTDEPRYPALALDPASGHTHLAWEEGGQVRYALRTDDGWQRDDATWRGDSPALAIDDDGNPHLAYVDLSPIDAQLQVFYVFKADDAWSLPQNVSGTVGPSTAPDLSIAVGDAIHVVWSERLDRANRIYHASSQDGGLVWTQVVPIPDAHGYAPSLATASGEVVWAAWQGAYDIEQEDTSSIWVAQWDGEAWSAPDEVSQSVFAGTSHLPDLLVSADGTLHVAWEQEIVPGAPVIMHREGQPQNWGQVTPLSSGQGMRPALAFDAMGRVVVAWDAGAQASTRIRMPDGTWGSVSSVGGNPAGIRDVACAPSSRGLLDVVWSAKQEDGIGSLWCATQLVDWTPTPSPSPTSTATATPTPTPTATSSPTNTSPPTIEAPTVTATSEGTVPAPTASPTLDVTIPAPTPTQTEPGPTMPPPTLDLPYAIFFPFMDKGPPGSEPNPLGNANVQLAAREARNLPRGTPSASPTAAHDPWRWSGIRNVSSSGMDSRDVAVVWQEDTAALAVWAESYPAFSMLAYSSLDNGVWSTPVSFYVGEWPDLAVDASGIAHLAFVNEIGGTYNVYYATWDGAQWSLPQNVSSTSGHSNQPAITIGSDGQPIILWSDTTELAQRIYYGWLEDGLWSTYIVPGSVQGSAPDIALTKDQRVWATWQALEPWGIYEVYASWGDGSSWQDFAILVSGQEQADSLAPRMASSLDQGACLVWQESSTETISVEYSDTIEDNYWWALPEAVSSERGMCEQPSIAVRPGGQTYVAWSQGDNLALTSRYPSATTWLSPTLLADSGAALRSPELAYGTGSRLLAMWSAAQVAGASDIHGQQGLFQPPYGLWLTRVSKHEPPLAQTSTDR